MFSTIPVTITIKNRELSAKLSISDIDAGLICLTYQVSDSVYASALIHYGSMYNSKILSFVSSNSNNGSATWNPDLKTFTVTLATNDVKVKEARACLKNKSYTKHIFVYPFSC